MFSAPAEAASAIGVEERSCDMRACDLAFVVLCLLPSSLPWRRRCASHRCLSQLRGSPDDVCGSPDTRRRVGARLVTIVSGSGSASAAGPAATPDCQHAVVFVRPAAADSAAFVVLLQFHRSTHGRCLCNALSCPLLLRMCSSALFACRDGVCLGVGGRSDTRPCLIRGCFGPLPCSAAQKTTCREELARGDGGLP